MPAEAALATASSFIPRRKPSEAMLESYIEMLNVMRRLYDLYGDPNIKEIIDRAELTLGR